MDQIQSFTGLKAWQSAHQLVLEIYEITRSFPKEERFGLTSQIRRAAVSISSNLAEGFSRQSKREKIQFYSVALGSLTETQNQLLICKDVKYINQDQFMTIADKTVTTSKLINGLTKSIKNRNL